jgi:hypothetical protein
MLRAISFVVKLALFSVLVLILGNWLAWDGKTLSDQVRDGVARVENTEWMGKARGWLGLGHDEPRRLAHRPMRQQHAHASLRHAAAERDRMSDSLVNEKSAETSRPTQEQVSPSERQKLRALIQELNKSGSTARN